MRLNQLIAIRPDAFPCRIRGMDSAPHPAALRQADTEHLDTQLLGELHPLIYVGHASNGTILQFLELVSNFQHAQSSTVHTLMVLSLLIIECGNTIVSDTRPSPL